MSKIMKIIMSVLFIIFCSLFTTAVIESGKESRIKDLEDMRFEDSFILGIKNYHDLGNQNGP
jgi:hypothetical protein